MNNPITTHPSVSSAPFTPLLPANQGIIGTDFVNPSVLPTVSSHSPFGQLMQQRGKAPPVDPFTAEDKELRFDDWVPILERATTRNNWSEEEKLIQLAGHLRNKALQEWNLMSSQEKGNYHLAIATLRTQLGPGNKTLAAMDFCHITQQENESVSDFIMRLERTFQLAFGRDNMLPETHDVLLYGKLQDGLRIELVSKAPAISGAPNYQELCFAAKNEERRLVELERRRQYARSEVSHQPIDTQLPRSEVKREKLKSHKQLRCYICDGPRAFCKSVPNANVRKPRKV